MPPNPVPIQIKEIRPALHDNEWWFAVEDVVLEIETGDKVINPENYHTEPESRKRLKVRNREEEK